MPTTELDTERWLVRVDNGPWRKVTEEDLIARSWMLNYLAGTVRFPRTTKTARKRPSRGLRGTRDR